MWKLKLHIRSIQLILTTFVFMTIVSCNSNKNKFNENQILGEWKYVPEVHVKSNSLVKESDVPPPPSFNMSIKYAGFRNQKVFISGIYYWLANKLIIHIQRNIN